MAGRFVLVYRCEWVQAMFAYRDQEISVPKGKRANLAPEQNPVASAAKKTDRLKAGNAYLLRWSATLMIRSTFITLFMMLGVQAEPPSKNFIKNSSFEILTEEGAPVGWSASGDQGAVSIDPANAQQGRIGLHLALSGKMVMLGQRKYFSLTPGKQYTFSAWVKTKGLEPPANFQLQIINLGWSFSYQTRLPIRETNSDWKRYSKTFVCPPAGAFKYKGQDNVLYKAVIHAKGVKGAATIDALQLEEGTSATDYVAQEGTSTPSGDPVYDAIVASMERRSLKKSNWFQIKDPLFEELLTDVPGPNRVLYYGYQDLMTDGIHRPYAKKFGHRDVLHEQSEELRSNPLIPMTNGWPRGGVLSYPTMRMILRPDVKGVAPAVFNGNPWIMDPKWQEAYLQSAIRLAEQSTDHRPGNAWGNTWGLWAGDEVFESGGIKVVPLDKRYYAVHAIDREVKERFGFGKFGMPESADDANPFRRIAFRRWVNAKLTETYRKTHTLVKKINPKLVMLGPDPSGMVPPVDLEAMTPYFDLVSNQSWYDPSSFTHQLATGADTKAMADLSVCPVWALVQHFAAKEPEAMREQFSQVYRNGGEGLVLLGVEWYDRELEHPKYINPAKWRALLEIANTVTKMNKVRLPKPDTAVLYASDTYLTFDSPKMANSEHPQVYAAYATLGPSIGSWFSFVSDRQIVRGSRKLSDYKALYIPLATYQRSAVVDKIKQYARDGGTVVCTDPTAFSWDINGESISQKWVGVTGVEMGQARAKSEIATTEITEHLRTPKLSLRFSRPGVTLAPIGAFVAKLAEFADGSPAATIRPFGKGYVIVFASDPFASVDKNASFIRLFESIQKFAGARVGLDIWRFKLPPFKTVSVADADANLCLTGNYVIRDARGIRPGHKLMTGGTYTYDRFPTGIQDAAKSGDLAFADGHLTNRWKAYAGRKLGGTRHPPSPEKWIVSWADKEPVELVFDLKKSHAIDRMTVFYSGELPEMTVYGSIDLKAWDQIGSHPAQPSTADIIDVTVLLRGRHRHMKVSLGERKGGRPMELVEIELWGSP